MFWVFAAFIGYFYVTSRNLGWGYLAPWVGWLFLSTLAHDFGHVVAARLAGRRGQIILGSIPSWETPAKRRWQRIAIALAGPAAGFLFYGLALLIRDNVVPLFGVNFFAQRPELGLIINESLAMLSFMNLLWNAFNLLPIWSLDGGEVSLEIFSGISRANGYRVAFGLSALLTAGAAAYSVLVWMRPELPYLGILNPTLKGIHPGLMAGVMVLMTFLSIHALVKAERERRGESGARAREQDERNYPG
jgi:Zn-dependent protease